MRKKLPQRTLSKARTGQSLACATALVAIACALTAPNLAKAIPAQSLAHTVDDNGNNVYYTSVEAAVQAGYSGETVIMDDDWTLTSTLIVSDNKTITIDMNGHRITQSGAGKTIRLYRGANVTLKSSQTSSGSYKGYNASDGSVTEVDGNFGGLITGDTNTNSGGIGVDAGATITLDNVVVGGCGSSGMYVGKNTTINLQNNARVEHNKGDAGGIYVKGEEVAIHMDNAHIDYNYATDGGGAIYSDDDATRISMKNKSTMSYNHAENGGGAVYFHYSYYNILSDDNSAVMSNNTSNKDGGGAIHIKAKSNKTNEGEIRGVTFSNNVARAASSHYAHGGAICNEQRYLNITNCTFTNNHAGEQGGAVYISGNNCGISNCTITGNVCNASTTTSVGNYYGGGGVYVDGHCDINLTGTVVVTGNTRGENSSNRDDLFLDNDVNLSSAYMKGSVSTDSKIGVRTGIDEDRRIAKNFSNNGNHCFFMDLDDYYVSYGTDSGGDMWQRHTKLTYLAKVNGADDNTRYSEGTTVTANGTSADPSKVFWRWSQEKTTGLSPFATYVTDIYNPHVTYSMPQNDVNLVAEYVDAVNNVTLSVERPVADQDLPAAAKLSWGDGSYATVKAKWLEEDGSVATKAEYGESYKLYVTVDSEKDKGFAFSSALAKDNVALSINDGKEGPGVSEAHVDSNNTLYITTNEFATEKADVNSVDETALEVTEGTSQSEALAALPAYANANLSGNVKSIMATDKSNITWPSGLFGADGKVSVDVVGKTFEIKVPLAASNKVKSVAGKYVLVTVSVLPAETPATPVFTYISGTYDRYNSDVKMDSNLKLAVKATCATPSATLQYKVDANGAVKDYVDSTGIELTGVANSQEFYQVFVRAKNGSAYSDWVEADYLLDDTLNKTVSIACSDTALCGDGEQRWSASFDVTGNLYDTVTATAPAQEGRVFDHWEWSSAPGGTDLTKTTLEIQDFKLSYSGSIKAVYVPVLSSVNIEISQPVAGKALPAKAVIKTGSGSDAKDISQCFAYSGAISWLPAAGSNGKAAYATVYTAMVSLNANSGSDYKYALADNVKLLVNGKEATQGSYVGGSGSAKMGVVVFEATNGSQKASLVDRSLTEALAFDVANAYNQEQESGKASAWNLPRMVSLKYDSGETESVDVTWDEVSGFDPNALGEQTVTVTGAASLPSNVDKTTVSSTVTATLKIEAPQTVAKPVASVASGAYKKSRTVKLATTTEDAKIYYTTDGSEPTRASAEYDEPIEISATTVVKARAYCDGMLASKVATYKYAIGIPAKVKGLKAKQAGKKAVKLSWKKAKAQRSGVQVRYSAKKSMKDAKKTLAKGKAVKAKKIKKLKSGKRCYFQARAYVTVNGKRCYSSWSKRVSIKVK